MEALRQKVQNQKITMALHICLCYTKTNYRDMEQIGTIWIDNNIFLINIHIFGCFIDRKPDTIKHNLSDHGFSSVRMKYKEKYKIFNKFNVNPISVKSWVAKMHRIYCINSTGDIVNLLKFHHTKKSKSSSFMLFSNDDDYNNDYLYFEDYSENDYQFMIYN